MIVGFDKSNYEPKQVETDVSDNSKMANEVEKFF